MRSETDLPGMEWLAGRHKVQFVADINQRTYAGNVFQSFTSI